LHRHHRRGPTALSTQQRYQPRAERKHGRALATPAATAAETTRRAGQPLARPHRSDFIEAKSPLDRAAASLAGLRLPAAHARRAPAWRRVPHPPPLRAAAGIADAE